MTANRSTADAPRCFWRRKRPLFSKTTAEDFASAGHRNENRLTSKFLRNPGSLPWVHADCRDFVSRNFYSATG